jgi:phosphatidylethanolamine-binding protein (PEBP) family uncharacterized protein
MAIQFPPINAGDPEPQNGDTYLYLVTQEEFECHRRSQLEAAQWSARGTINTTTFGYRGTLEIQQTAPTDADTGNIYSVSDGGIADASFTGLAGTDVEQWSLVIFANPEWVLVSAAATSPWVRTVGGQIQPIIQTDDLNMVNGDYVIESLPFIGDVANNGGGNNGGGGGGNTDLSIALSTTSWSGTDALAQRFFFNQNGCPGSNDSPALSYTITGTIPAGATVRLRCVDADAQNFIHWSVDNIAPGIAGQAQTLAENFAPIAGSTVNASDFGGGERANGWAGPCPPASSGDHNYNFTVQLVDTNGTQLAISNTLTSTIPT